MTTPLNTALRGHRPMTMMSGVMALVAVVAFVGLFADDRVLLGQPIWLKPMKFGISLAVYGFTLAWLMAYLEKGRRVAWWAGMVITVASLTEIAVIVTQVIRGRASHFNQATALDTILWIAMGVTIVVLWVSTLVISIVVWRQGMPDRATTWAVRLGLVMLLLGLAQGFLMTQPTAAQVAEGETVSGAHSVGVVDGGPSMALTGWSTTGGDLRIGHFVGIHSLQAILLLAMLLPRLVPDVARRTRLIVVFAFAYTGLFVLVTWQALRGQSLIAPDAKTLAALGVLVVGSALGTVIALRRKPVTSAD